MVFLEATLLEIAQEITGSLGKGSVQSRKWRNQAEENGSFNLKNIGPGHTNILERPRFSGVFPATWRVVLQTKLPELADDSNRRTGGPCSSWTP